MIKRQPVPEIFPDQESLSHTAPAVHYDELRPAIVIQSVKFLLFPFSRDDFIHTEQTLPQYNNFMPFRQSLGYKLYRNKSN